MGAVKGDPTKFYCVCPFFAQAVYYAIKMWSNPDTSLKTLHTTPFKIQEETKLKRQTVKNYQLVFVMSLNHGTITLSAPQHRLPKVTPDLTPFYESAVWTPSCIGASHPQEERPLKMGAEMLLRHTVLLLLSLSVHMRLAVVIQTPEHRCDVNLQIQLLFHHKPWEVWCNSW